MNHEIEQILQQISVYLPDSRIVQAVIIVIAAVLLSRLVALVIDTTLKRLAGKTRSDLDDKMVAFIQAPLVKTIVLAGLALAVANLGLDDKVVFVTVKLLLTIMVIVWAFPLAGLLKSLLVRPVQHGNTSAQFSLQLCRYLTMLEKYWCGRWQYL